MLKNILRKSIAAGILISIGATVKMNCNSPIIGAVLFSIGLFFICTFGMYLFTGKIAHINKKEWHYYLVIWLGNLIGCIISMLFIRIANPNSHTICIPIMEAKLDKSIFTTSALAFFCGIIMFLAVENYKKSESEISKVFGIVIGVTGFLVAGFEHSIADMAYSILYISTWNEVIKCLLYILNVTIFNAFGSIFMRKLIAQQQ